MLRYITRFIRRASVCSSLTLSAQPFPHSPYTSAEDPLDPIVACDGSSIFLCNAC